VPDDGISSIYFDSQAAPILLDAIYSPWLPTLSRRQLEGGGQLLSGIESTLRSGYLSDRSDDSEIF